MAASKQECLAAVERNQIHKCRLSFDLEIADIQELIHARVKVEQVQPDIVLPNEVTSQKAYRRFRESEKKNRFRNRLIDLLSAKWSQGFGQNRAESAVIRFRKVVGLLEQDGAVIFGDLVDQRQFSLLVERYSKIMEEHGSHGLLHSYVNLRNFPDFIFDQSINEPFFHPLLLIIIAYRIGGPIRLVDARAKDAQPILAQAQDNMLHIDNTPFNDEYKILVTWEKGKPSGSKGQNFVFVPHTHCGVRNCFIGGDGTAWSTENASIFTTPQSVEKVFEFQAKVCSESLPLVVEVQDPDRPTSIVFAAGSLVHHRLRTATGRSRSCIILAFHHWETNSEQFCGDRKEPVSRPRRADILNSWDNGREGGFEGYVVENAPGIAKMLFKIFGDPPGPAIIKPQENRLSPDELEAWKRIVISAPKVEDIKRRDLLVPHGLVEVEIFASTISKMMLFDKHGPLDLILYEDGHEEIRKWARNRIREMRPDFMASKLIEWNSDFEQPSIKHLLLPEEIERMALQLVNSIAEATAKEVGPIVDDIEKIEPSEAWHSLRQLIIDLGEAITRSYSIQNYLSTSLFLFWACDELIRMNSSINCVCKQIGGRLLRNYVATALLELKQGR